MTEPMILPVALPGGEAASLEAIAAKLTPTLGMVLLGQLTALLNNTKLVTDGKTATVRAEMHSATDERHLHMSLSISQGSVEHLNEAAIANLSERGHKNGFDRGDFISAVARGMRQLFERIDAKPHDLVDDIIALAGIVLVNAAKDGREHFVLKHAAGALMHIASRYEDGSLTGRDPDFDDEGDTDPDDPIGKPVGRA